jgi:hypothetical protein
MECLALELVAGVTGSLPELALFLFAVLAVSVILLDDESSAPRLDPPVAFFVEA